MGINLGSTAIAGLKLGSTQVDKIYLGSTQVWGGSSPTPGGDYHGWGYFMYDDPNANGPVQVVLTSSTDVDALAYSNGMPVTIEGVSYDPSYIASIVLGDEVTTLGSTIRPFRAMSGLESITLPSTLTELPAGFCNNCTNLTTVNLPATGLVTIGYSFLQGCGSFNSPLVIPSTVTSIGQQFMQNCSSFNQPLTLPSGIANIGDRFLFNDIAMCSTIYLGSLPSTILDLQGGRTLATTNGGAAMYTTGITLVGDYVSDWMTVLPNSDTSPYRKLINGNS